MTAGVVETGKARMAKQQKTFYLNADLARLIDVITEHTGTSFTKIVTSALIQTLFGSSSGPQPRWMKLAVALERREVTVPQLPALAARDEVRYREQILGLHRKDASEDPAARALRINQALHQFAVQDLENSQRLQLAGPERDDPLELLIQVFSSNPWADTKAWSYIMDESKQLPDAEE